MGRKSTEHRSTQKSGKRVKGLQETLRRTVDGDAVFWSDPDCPPETLESHLEEVLAFESVGSGTSLFIGLQEHGMDLPEPGKLNERQSARKLMEVLNALADLQVFLIGFEGMSARELYAKVWNETLWEGCYVEKRTPGALTLIDVSHKIPRKEILAFLEGLKRTACVQ